MKLFIITIFLCSINLALPVKAATITVEYSGIVKSLSDDYDFIFPGSTPATPTSWNISVGTKFSGEFKLDDTVLAEQLGPDNARFPVEQAVVAFEGAPEISLGPTDRINLYTNQGNGRDTIYFAAGETFGGSFSLYFYFTDIVFTDYDSLSEALEHLDALKMIEVISFAYSVFGPSSHNFGYCNASCLINTELSQFEISSDNSNQTNPSTVPLPASGFLLLAGLGAMFVRRAKTDKEAGLL